MPLLTELLDLPMPVASVALPSCASNCDEIRRANVACVTAADVNDCFCSVIPWPTACSSVCREAEERTSVARWYWDVCPSAMDSRLGQFGLTKESYPRRTVDAWAVQSPTTSGAVRRGYDCPSSGSCSTTLVSTSTTASATSATGTPSARSDGRCGKDFGGVGCDPNGPYGGCCSEFGLYLFRVPKAIALTCIISDIAA
jgi:hypothetical protein